MRWGRGDDGGRGEPVLPPLEETRTFAAEVALGDAARDARDWPGAALHYRAALKRDPAAIGIWVQLGHAVKEAGDPVAAEAAYRHAQSLDPGNADIYVQLGHVLKALHRRDEAIAAYAAALRADPEIQSARRELADLGARDALPAADSYPAERWRRLTAMAEVLAGGTAALRDWIGTSAYPLAAYDRFRRDIAIRPPPGALPTVVDGTLIILIDATSAAPFLLRATLRSLQDQSIGAWRATVIAPPAIRDHPVGSFATTDPRISFATAIEPTALEDGMRIVPLTAGTVLDPEALAWLAFAVDRTGAAAAFADEDQGVIDPSLGLVRDTPVLRGALDPVALCERTAPALVIADAALLRAARTDDQPFDALRRDVLLAAVGSAPHVARLLATTLHLPLVADGGRRSDDDAVPGRLGPAPSVAPPRAPVAPHDGRIAIVIPTRDSAIMLARTIESLRTTARDPARLDIVIVDNRSAEPETARLIDDLSARGIARPIAFDAPFNWSLASNLGAAASDAPTILFANNDIEMRSSGWDDAVLEALADPAVGAVGARLLYPDNTVQHGGMVFGLGNGGAEHEGRGQPGDEAGPDRRLVTPRTVAAVTGAFLAVRRGAFDAIGGFDAERLMIGHSDVDLCLRLREAGLLVRYCPAIEALHHEGATRGRNEKRADIAWDEGERADLIDRWGAALEEDPGISPYWAKGGVPFDGLREPGMREIVRHIDRTARSDCWRPSRRADQERAEWSPAALR